MKDREDEMVNRPSGKNHIDSENDDGGVMTTSTTTTMVIMGLMKV